MDPREHIDLLLRLDFTAPPVSRCFNEHMPPSAKTDFHRLPGLDRIAETVDVKSAPHCAICRP